MTNALVTSNLELPKMFVGQYLKQHPSYVGMKDDLLSVSYEALVIEAGQFKPGKASFRTRAWWRMRTAAIELVRTQFGAVTSRAPQAASQLPDTDTAGEFKDPADTMDAARTWEAVKDGLQAIPVAAGKGFKPRRAGDAADYLALEFGGHTFRDIADRRGVSPQTVHEQAVRMRVEFLKAWPEAAAYFEAANANED